MCLSVPGKVVEVREDEIVLEYPGEVRRVEVSLVDLEVGDFCIVAGGIVVDRIEKKRAEKFLEVLND